MAAAIEADRKAQAECAQPIFRKLKAMPNPKKHHALVFVPARAHRTAGFVGARVLPLRPPFVLFVPSSSFLVPLSSSSGSARGGIVLAHDSRRDCSRSIETWWKIRGGRWGGHCLLLLGWWTALGKIFTPFCCCHSALAKILTTLSRGIGRDRTGLVFGPEARGMGRYLSWIFPLPTNPRGVTGGYACNGPLPAIQEGRTRVWVGPALWRTRKPCRSEGIVRVWGVRPVQRRRFSSGWQIPIRQPPPTGKQNRSKSRKVTKEWAERPLRCSGCQQIRRFFKGLFVPAPDWSSRGAESTTCAIATPFALAPLTPGLCLHTAWYHSTRRRTLTLGIAASPTMARADTTRAVLLFGYRLSVCFRAKRDR